VACLQVAQKAVSQAADASGGPRDARVNAARMLTELLMFYISRTDMYRSGGGKPTSAAAGPADISQPLDELLSTRVAPLLQSMMLSGCDPMPLYAQKVLATLLPRCAHRTHACSGCAHLEHTTCLGAALHCLAALQCECAVLQAPHHADADCCPARGAAWPPGHHARERMATQRRTRVLFVTLEHFSMLQRFSGRCSVSMIAYDAACN
jgi:hypothetical protein